MSNDGFRNLPTFLHPLFISLGNLRVRSKFIPNESSNTLGPANAHSMPLRTYRVICIADLLIRVTTSLYWPHSLLSMRLKLRGLI